MNETKKKIALIDYENVHEGGFAGAKDCTDIYIFFTQNSMKLNLDSLDGISGSFNFIKVAPGKQSLDMHLISYLGYMLGMSQSKEYSYVIVSNDTDFDKILAFWASKGFNVSRFATNIPTPIIKQLTKKKSGRNARRKTVKAQQAEEIQAQTENAMDVPMVEIEVVPYSAPAPEAAAKNSAPAAEKKTEVGTEAAEKKAEPVIEKIIQTAVETAQSILSGDSAKTEEPKKTRRRSRKTSGKKTAKAKDADTAQQPAETTSPAPTTEQ